jgi:hypothetical protein
MARNDQATGVAFPLGRWISTRLEAVRLNALSGGPADAQEKANLNTIGHLRWLITHRLSAAGSPESSPHQAYEGRVSSNFDNEELAFDTFNKQFRRDGHLMSGWKRTYPEGALLEQVAGNPDNPFWTVEATPEVVDGHNGDLPAGFPGFPSPTLRRPPQACQLTKRWPILIPRRPELR